MICPSFENSKFSQKKVILSELNNFDMESSTFLVQVFGFIQKLVLFKEWKLQE